MRRAAKARFEAIEPAIRRRDEFLERLKSTTRPDLLAAMMAEAIDMHIEANGLEVVGRDGRVAVSMEDVSASHCLIAARDAYRAAIGSNQ